jgi:hypothetical protein
VDVCVTGRQGWGADDGEAMAVRLWRRRQWQVRSGGAGVTGTMVLWSIGELRDEAA